MGSLKICHTEKNTKKYENSVDKAGGKTQKNRRGEVAINVTSRRHRVGSRGRQRGEDRMNFSEFSHLKHQKKT